MRICYTAKNWLKILAAFRARPPIAGMTREQIDAQFKSAVRDAGAEDIGRNPQRPARYLINQVLAQYGMRMNADTKLVEVLERPGMDSRPNEEAGAAKAPG